MKTAQQENEYFNTVMSNPDLKPLAKQMLAPNPEAYARSRTWKLSEVHIAVKMLLMKQWPK